MSGYTFTFDQIIKIVGRNVPKNITDDHGADICNLAYNMIWSKYDWRESLVTLPPFWLIPNEQDYGAPFISVPSDFWGLRKVELVNLQSAPPMIYLLKIKKDLELTQTRFIPHAISYNMDTASFRVFPRVPDNLGCPFWMMYGTYKRVPLHISNKTMATTIPTKDIYIDMWIEAMKFYGFNFASDQRAQNSYMLCMQAMERAAMSEGLELGDVSISPTESLTNTFPWSNQSNILGFNI